jgi:hypothetical protein
MAGLLKVSGWLTLKLASREGWLAFWLAGLSGGFEIEKR